MVGSSYSARGQLKVQGYLDKWCRKIYRWKEKWVTIEIRNKLPILCYFKIINTNNDIDYKSEKNVILQDVEIYEDFKYKDVFKIKVKVHSSYYKYKFRAKSEEKSKMWIFVILNANISNKVVYESLSKNCSSTSSQSQNINYSQKQSRTLSNCSKKSNNSLDYHDKSINYTDKLENKPLQLTCSSKNDQTYSSQFDLENKVNVRNFTRQSHHSDQFFFNNIDFLFKKLKWAEQTIKRIMQICCDNIINLDDDDTKNIIAIYNETKKLNTDVTDILQKYTDLIHIQNIQDLISSQSSDTEYLLDESIFVYSPPKISYFHFFSSCQPILSQNSHLSIEYLPANSIQTRTLTELVARICLQPKHLIKLSTEINESQIYTHFTKYICCCLQEFITNKSYFIGIPIISIIDERFACYITNGILNNQKIFLDVRCVSVDPIKLIIRITNNLCEFDIEICLSLSLISNDNQENRFIVRVYGDGLFSLWKMDKTYTFIIPELKIIYDEANINIIIEHIITISSKNKIFCSFIELSDNKIVDKIKTKNQMNNNLNNLFSSSIDNCSIKTDQHNTIINGIIEKYENHISTYFIQKIILFIFFCCKLCLNLILIDDNECEDTMNDSQSSKSDSNAIKMYQNDEIYYNISVKPFLNCRIYEISNEVSPPNDITQIEPIKACSYSLTDFSKVQNLNICDNIPFKCYVMSSICPKINKYLSKKIWSNAIDYLKQEKYEKFKQEYHQILLKYHHTD